jgi:hypothetical protein
MKPIDEISIAKSINFFKSLTPEEKVKYCEKIQQLQPFAFRAIIAMIQEGVSVQKLEHGINLLMVIHHAFYSNCRSLPLITGDMLRDALEGNVAMLQSIDRGWLTHEKTLLSYPERVMLAFIICYIKHNNLGSLCKENESLITRIKTVLDTYAKVKSVAANNIRLH